MDIGKMLVRTGVTIRRLYVDEGKRSGAVAIECFPVGNGKVE